MHICRPQDQIERMMSGVMPLRCVIVDDNPHFVASAVSLLERDDVDVLGTATSSAEALRLLDELRPDVTLVDVDLGTESGFDLAELIHLRDSPGAQRSAVILISAHSPQDLAEMVAASPAVGFLPKVELSARAIREMLAGG
jgi:DNA-binding NarL/FixJ family response regulator